MNENLLIDDEFSIKSFSSQDAIEKYKAAVDDVGLWKSEELIINKYLNTDSKILDVGCGAGRTTFGIYKLGFKNLVGIDISKLMINEAKRINEAKNLSIPFYTQDVKNLKFDDLTFDAVLLSFTGFTQIPGEKNRNKAAEEIYRVLKKKGKFIFTTHDRDDPNYADFWKEEEMKWENGNNDKRLELFGDRVIKENDREMYIHFPTKKEMIEIMKKNGFSLVFDVLRSEFCEESEEVKKFSTDSRIWVFEK